MSGAQNSKKKNNSKKEKEPISYSHPEKKREDSRKNNLDYIGLTKISHAQMEQFRRKHESKVLTILLSDLEGSTKQQSELGNLRAAELVKAYQAIFRKLLESYECQEISTAGDSFVVVFAMPSEAVKFALNLQAALRKARSEIPDLPQVRIGIHQGQVVVEKSPDGQKPIEIYGVQVSTAARIMDLGRGGQILCSRTVFDDARAILEKNDFKGLSEISWLNHGPYRFKGVLESSEVCEVGEKSFAPLQPPPATTKSWPVGYSEEILGWRPSSGELVPETNWILVERLGKAKSAEGIFSRYKGEFGEVWKAWNPSSKAYQVFKFCFKHEYLRILKREARLLKKLQKHHHPNIVEVYDVTEGEKPPHYLEMEYVEGPSLEEWLETNPQLEDRLEIIAQVADALDTVHAAGIYHRDIKPSNILLTKREDGALIAKLSDFGLGAAEDKDLLKSISSTRLEGVSGTWDYIAPEIRKGKPASKQSDLYSLGVTLFQVVTGDIHRPLGDWEKAVPCEVLREDIRRCIASDPADRWQNASELAQALRAHDSRVRELELKRAHEKQKAKAKKLRLISSIAATITLIMIGLGSYALLQRQKARCQAIIAQKERDEAVKAKKRIEEELYYSQVLLAEKNMKVPRYDIARELLWNTPPHLRNWEWGLLLEKCYADLLTLEGHEGAITSIDFSPDGERLLTASEDKTARIWDLKTGREILRLSGDGAGIYFAEFSADGKLVLTVSSDHKAHIWDGLSGEKISTINKHHLPFILLKKGTSSRGPLSDEEIISFWEKSSLNNLYSNLKESDIDIIFKNGLTFTWNKLREEEFIRLFETLDQSMGIVSARFSPDGSFTLVASGNGGITLFDQKRGKTILEIEEQDPTLFPNAFKTTEGACHWLTSKRMLTALFSPDGKEIISSSKDGVLSFWDAKTGKKIKMFKVNEGPIVNVRFNRSGSRMLTASTEGKMKIWETGSWKELLNFGGAGTGLLDVVFTPDGRYIASSSLDLMGYIWDGQNGKKISHFIGRPLAVDPGSRYLAVTILGGVSIIDIPDRKELFKVEGHSSLVDCAKFSPDGSMMATASSDSTARIWDAHKPLDSILIVDGQDPVNKISLSHDNKHLLTFSWGNSVKVWDVEKQRLIVDEEVRRGLSTQVSLDSKGTKLALPLQNNEAVIIDLNNLGKRIFLKGHRGEVISVRFSPDGMFVVTTSEDHTVKLWETTNGKERITFKGHEDTVWDVDFNPDGERILTQSRDRTARIWDLKTGKQKASLKGHLSGLHSALFSPDGTRVVTTAAETAIKIWDASTGKLLKNLTGHTANPWQACFSPDGTLVLSAARDKTARIWDVETGKELFTLKGHSVGVYSARFSPDGSRIVTTGGLDSKIWETRTGRELLSLVGHRGGVNDAIFSQDGRLLITASEDGTVRIWKTSPWKADELPGDKEMSWRERYRLWHFSRYQENLKKNKIF